MTYVTRSIKETSNARARQTKLQATDRTELNRTGLDGQERTGNVDRNKRRDERAGKKEKEKI